MTDYRGSCFCQSVKLEVKGDPVASVVCHCKICRQWSASPVNGATLWKPEDVNITAGKEHLNSFAKNEGGGTRTTKYSGFSSWRTSPDAPLCVIHRHTRAQHFRSYNLQNRVFERGRLMVFCNIGFLRQDEQTALCCLGRALLLFAPVQLLCFGCVCDSCQECQRPMFAVLTSCFAGCRAM